MKVGDILVVRNIDEIESLGACSEGLVEGDEYSVLTIGDKCLTVVIDGIREEFTLEPARGYGLSWKSFFTVKEF